MSVNAFLIALGLFQFLCLFHVWITPLWTWRNDPDFTLVFEGVFDVFEGYCCRIPTMIYTCRGTLLAVAEKRYGSCGDQGQHDLVLRRSSDHGKTWGDIITILKGEGEPISNPNIVEAKLRDGTTAVLLHYDTMNNPSPEHHGDNMQIWSYDDGVTWVDRQLINFVPPLSENYLGCMPGPSVGIQSPEKTIYFSCHPTSPSHVSFIYYSKDFGETWQVGDIVEGHELDECSIAFLTNGSLAMNCRISEGAERQHRAQLTFTAEGRLINGPFYPEGLTDPGCQGSMISVGSTLYLSNANSDLSRENLTVKRSEDDGVSWDSGVVVDPDFSAYSQLVSWQNNKKTYLGVLYEAGRGIGFRHVVLPDHNNINAASLLGFPQTGKDDEQVDDFMHISL